jgi:hypothetical protein
MTITKEHITIKTTTSVIGLILSIGAIFAIFYNAKADASDRVNDVSQRVAKLEATSPEINRRLENIEGSLQTLNSAVLQVVNKK